MNKAVLFDLDGTLIDSSEGITKSVQYTLKKFGIVEEDLEKLKAFIGPPLEDSFMKHYNFTMEKAKEAIPIYRERYQPVGIFECTLFDGVEECVKELKRQGFRIGMASSKPELFCRKILEHFNILTLFDDVVGATEDGRIGTKEEVLLEVMRRWDDVPKESMCLVGDTIYDVEGANLVGIPSVGVSFGFGNIEEMIEAGARAICFSMSEVSKTVTELIHK